MVVLNHHLVILKKPYLDAVLAGRKTIESRFMKNNRPPFGKVNPGDKLFLKVSSGPVCGMALVAAVENFENLTPAKIAQIRHRFNEQIIGSEEYWQSRADCKVGFLAWLSGIEAIEPIRIDKKDWRGWVILTPQNNFGLLRSITTEKERIGDRC